MKNPFESPIRKIALIKSAETKRLEAYEVAREKSRRKTAGNYSGPLVVRTVIPIDKPRIYDYEVEENVIEASHRFTQDTAVEPNDYADNEPA